MAASTHHLYWTTSSQNSLTWWCRPNCPVPVPATTQTLASFARCSERHYWDGMWTKIDLPGKFLLLTWLGRTEILQRDQLFAQQGALQSVWANIIQRLKVYISLWIAPPPRESCKLRHLQGKAAINRRRADGGKARVRACVRLADLDSTPRMEVKIF